MTNIDLEENLLDNYVPSDDENEEENESTTNEREDYVSPEAQGTSGIEGNNGKVLTSNVKRRKRILIQWTEDQKKMCYYFFCQTY